MSESLRVKSSEYIDETTRVSFKFNGKTYFGFKKTEIETGIRSKGNLEVVSGLQSGDKIVAEGLGKARPGAKIKPIINN